MMKCHVAPVFRLCISTNPGNPVIFVIVIIVFFEMVQWIGILTSCKKGHKKPSNVSVQTTTSEQKSLDLVT